MSLSALQLNGKNGVTASHRGLGAAPFISLATLLRHMFAPL